VGAPAPPGRIKFFRRNSQGKFVSALQAEQESIFMTFFAVSGRFGA